MRKSSLWVSLFVCLFVGAFVSCSTDDPDPDAYDFNNSIAAGNWHIDSVRGFYDMEYMNGIVLDSTYVGGRLQLDAEQLHYVLYNGRGERTSEGSWRAGRWYVRLTQNGSAEDTLGVSFGGTSYADFNPAAWSHHLNLYKSHQVAAAHGGGTITDKEVTLFMSK